MLRCMLDAIGAMKRNLSQHGGVLAALFGALMVPMVLGWGPLNPNHVGWMLFGPLGPDTVQIWLGRGYFEQTPWLWPPGANPAWGIELASGIFYTDSIPLLLFLFKALRGVAQLAQYAGPWMLLCGALHGWLGWRLVALVTEDPLARLAGAGLLAMQPVWFNRMAGHVHLVAQWVLLAALVLALRPGGGAGRRLAWVGLVTLTSLLNPYLLVMVAVVWGGDWLRRVAWERGVQAPGAALLEAGAGFGGVLLALWCSGFFMLRGGFASGSGSEFGTYGSWGLDLLAFFDGGTWSSFLPDLPDTGHWETGGSYLGLGGVLLVLAGAFACWRRPVVVPWRLWPVVAALGLLLAFAVTHRVAVAGHVVTLLPLSDQVLAALGTLRNSERMAMPVIYALLLMGMACCVRAWGGRNTGLLLAALLLVQAVDLRPGVTAVRAMLAPAPDGVPARLQDAFWPEAAGVYARVRAVPAGNIGPGWQSIAQFAMQAGLPTDSVYLARVDGAVVAALRARMAEVLRSGAYEPATLYVLRDSESVALAQASHDPARDAIMQVDGYWVLAPGWLARR
jgi:hypothetical protein